MLAVAILMKDPAEAKTRLKAHLGSDARGSLALAMFENALRFFARFEDLGPIGVVTRSSRIGQIATLYGAQVIDEGEGGDINAAAAAASNWALGIGASPLLVFHGDIPTLLDEEFAALLDAASRNAVVIAESRDGGTNALVVSPSNAIPFSYGKRSASAHELSARAAGLRCERVRLRYMSRDIDTPEDLQDCFADLSGDSGGSPISSVRAFAVPGIPEISAGDDLGQIIVQGLSDAALSLRSGDIVVVAQKVVSKSEGRMRRLQDFEPSAEALRIGAEIGKSPHKVEAILSESSAIIRARRQPPDGLIITRHKHGWICANAGIDESNLGEGNDGKILLLPSDPDRSAREIRTTMERRFAVPIGVVITDTFGRPWRQGLVNIAIGLSGVPAVVNWAGRKDAFGRGLKVTMPAFADEVSALGGMLMSKDAKLPVVIVRGIDWHDDPGASARDILRPYEQELFL